MEFDVFNVLVLMIYLVSSINEEIRHKVDIAKTLVCHRGLTASGIYMNKIITCFEQYDEQNATINDCISGQL